VKDGIELARGWHRRVGTPHAERDALAKLPPGAAVGATAYVTLEPCSTHGRTGACTEALIAAGVSRVVYGARDPNPAHVGRADKVLREAGIEVTSGVCEEDCLHLIRGFAMVQKEGRPWVIAKTAMSLDGRITRPPGEGQWLSGPGAREEVQLLRASVDAIVTSGETVRRDDPALTLRSSVISPNKEQPWRVVITRKQLDRSKFQLFNDRFAERTLVFENLDLKVILEQLVENKGVTQILLEAGGGLLGSFLDAGLIDEWVIFLTPMVTGGPSPSVGGAGVPSLAERLSLKNLSIDQVGDDLCARGLVDRSGPRPLLR
jgi:diaminohydroxyphosphoribosylaminopyrimidine deaminase/5-amino-6-(5-phosphoribosylamino)uracil reductase